MQLFEPGPRRWRVTWQLLRFVSGVYLRRHAGQAGLIVATVALGVAAIVATGSLIESALASLEITREATAEHADLRVANGFAGVPEDLVEAVRGVEGVASAGGVLLGSARLRLAGGDSDAVLIGIDLLAADAVHRDSFSREQLEILDEADFLVRPEAIALDRAFAQRHAIALGSTLEAELANGRRRLYVAGLFEPSATSALFGGALAVMDLPAAQALLGRSGLVDAIDVQASSAAAIEGVRQRLEARVSGRATVTGVGGASPEWESLLYGLRMALGLTGCIAIVVGALVIHHAVAIVASQRKAQLDVVRAIGVSRRALLLLLSSEGLVLGSVGAAIGAALGALLATAAAGLFQQTVASLYAPIASPAVRISTSYLAAGSLLGVVITWAASIAPARGALRLASGGAGCEPEPRALARCAASGWDRRARRRGGSGAPRARAARLRTAGALERRARLGRARAPRTRLRDAARSRGPLAADAARAARPEAAGSAARLAGTHFGSRAQRDGGCRHPARLGVRDLHGGGGREPARGRARVAARHATLGPRRRRRRLDRTARLVARHSRRPGSGAARAAGRGFRRRHPARGAALPAALGRDRGGKRCAIRCGACRPGGCRGPCTRARGAGRGGGRARDASLRRAQPRAARRYDRAAQSHRPRAAPDRSGDR